MTLFALLAAVPSSGSLVGLLVYVAIAAVVIWAIIARMRAPAGRAVQPRPTGQAGADGRVSDLG